MVKKINLPIALFDTEERHMNLMPLSATRPVGEFRLGIMTLREKWARKTSRGVGFYPIPYLREAYPMPENDGDVLFVAGCAVPTPEFVDAVAALERGCGLRAGDEPLAYRGTAEEIEKFDFHSAPEFSGAVVVRYVFDLFLLNADEIRKDFKELTAGRESQPLSPTNIVVGHYEDESGAPRVFIEEGASIEGAVINLTAGPIYIGKDAQVMEGVLLRGPVAFCEKSKARMGAKIYGGSTFGPYCKVGGEIDNALFFGFSNKAHDGYLGNAVIGEWCNIGAGVNASNLKNDYSKIRIWNYASRTFMRTDLQFCGLIMGDHSKAGINCMFNTATVVGVGVNIHGAGFPRVFIPSFSEGSAAGGFSRVLLKKFYDIADRAMSRRDMSLSASHRKVYSDLYDTLK